MNSAIDIRENSDILINMNEDLVNALKEVLADSYSLYFKAKGYHWNVEGIHFAQFHDMFESIASDAYGATDPLAEYIRSLKAYAPFKMSRFLEISSVKEAEVGADCYMMLADLLVATEQILICVNRAFAIANSANQQGIANFLAERDAEHKKWAWQLRASLA
jgi:starvation-inducible DNA-binding protein